MEEGRGFGRGHVQKYHQVRALDEAAETRKERSIWMIVGLVAVTVTLFLVSGYKYSAAAGSVSDLSLRARSHKQSYSTSTQSTSSSDSMSIYTSNEYGVSKEGMFAYPFLADSLLAEPYKVTSFVISDAVGGATYTWSISTASAPTSDAASLYTSEVTSSSGDDSSVEASGSFTADETLDAGFTATLTSVGWYSLTVSEVLAGETSTSRTFSQPVVVKYVRRELEDLTDADRTAFLDAFHTLWEVNTIDGQALYGDNYKSLHYLASVHNDAGANAVCDEFHGGAGFLNNHVMLGSYLEQSLQLVDPTTCLHYMEYSKYFDGDAFQTHIINQLDKGTWTELLTSEYFGSSDPKTGRILDGRWANQTIPYMDANFYTEHQIDPDGSFFPYEADVWKGAVHLSSPYGLLRSPWNYNPDPYVTRYNALNMIASLGNMPLNVRAYYNGVTCAQYAKFIDKVRDGPMSDYLTYAEDDVHGIIHFTFGGAGGTNANTINKLLKDEYSFTDTELMLVQQSAQVFYKVVIALKNKPKDFAKTYGLAYPISCSDNPYDPDTYTVSTTAEVGSPGAPSCSVVSSFLEDEASLDTLIAFYFSLYKDGQEQYEVVEKVQGFDFDTKAEVMSLIISRLSFDGEMAGSGAAQDPLFWVAHGAVERLLQKVVFTNLLSDYAYGAAADEACSGHMANYSKAWLSGFYFQDQNVAAQTLTNQQLAEVLNPNSTLYSELVNYVYAESTFDWCGGSEEWFL